MAKDFQSQTVVDGYDEHIRKLIPGYELVPSANSSHFKNISTRTGACADCGRDVVQAMNFHIC